MSAGSGSTMTSLENDSGISEPDDEHHNSLSFENRVGLSQDLRFLSGMPEFCDVLFMVGEEREPIYGVKAILAIRSRVFFKMLLDPKNVAKQNSTGNSIFGQKSPSNKRFLQKSTGFSNSLSNLFVRDFHSSNGVQNQGPSTSGQKTVIEINDFDPDVFKQLLEYIHTGSVVLRTRTLLGLINAAEHFGIEELRRACADFSQKCINLDTICSLLVTAERYIQYKSTKNFVQKVLEFVHERSDQVLKLNDFVHLPLHVVELIMARCDTQASNLNKYRAADRWSRHHTMEYPEKTYRQLMIEYFIKYISFHLLPTPVLMREVRHLNIISDQQLMAALAYQADPASLSPPAMRRIRVQKPSNCLLKPSENSHKTYVVNPLGYKNEPDYQEIGAEKRMTVVHIDYEDEAYDSSGRVKSSSKLNDVDDDVDKLKF